MEAALEQLSRADPDHHLWRNGRYWWVAFTVHLPQWQTQRVRRSVGTTCRSEAHRRRDDVLREFARRQDCRLSIRANWRRGSQLRGTDSA